MTRRTLVAVVLVIVAAFGGVYAVRTAAVDGTDLLFNSAWWLIVAAPFAGILLAGFTKRRDPFIDGERVLRHDDAAILEHWTHGVGTMFLLISGISLGFLFVPRLLGRGVPVWTAMNVHFVAAVAFLFGTFYYAANTLLATKRFGEHLPTRNAFSFTIQHYGHLLGSKKYHMPPEDKYYESEKMAYVMALGGSALIVLTGLFKALAHVLSIPAPLMGAMTLVHDLSTLVMAAFFLAHVFFAAIAPFSWPVLGSMFTGYVSRDQVRKEHAGWYARLTGHAGDDTKETDAVA
jgi:formate dehydrogenase subunit gamma